jgi:hypothetical protein
MCTAIFWEKGSGRGLRGLCKDMETMRDLIKAIGCGILVALKEQRSPKDFTTKKKRNLEVGEVMSRAQRIGASTA